MSTSTSIAAQNVTPDLYAFEQLLQPDGVCGLSSMLAWVAGNNIIASTVWPTTRPGTTDNGSVAIAISAISTSASAPSSDARPFAVMTYMLNIIETFSLAMIYAQLAAMSIPTTMVTSDPLHVLVSNLVAVSVAKGPGATLADTLNTATSAVQAALEGSSNSHASILGILVPYMLTPFWTLSYYAAYADPTKRPNANIYDQRFGFMAVSETFGNWATFVQSKAPSGTATSALAAAVLLASTSLTSNATSVLTLGAGSSMAQQSTTAAMSGVDLLQTTNAQLERRKVSVGALSENLGVSRRLTGAALTTVLAWTTALVVAVGIAIFLLHSNNHSMLRTLIVVTVSLVTLDAVVRGVLSTGL